MKKHNFWLVLFALIFVVAVGGCGGGNDGEGFVSGGDADVFDGTWTSNSLLGTLTETGQSVNGRGVLKLASVGGSTSANEATKEWRLDVYEDSEYVESLGPYEMTFDVSSNSNETRLLLSNSAGTIEMRYSHSSGQLIFSIQVPGMTINGTFSRSESSVYSVKTEAESQSAKDIRNLINTLKENF
jgi:hypothetical protein